LYNFGYRAREKETMKILKLLFVMMLLSAAVFAQEIDTFDAKRQEMVSHQIKDRGIIDTKVLEAMEKVKRHLFVPQALRGMAYEDRPWPIGHKQTISQPYIVAYMTEAAQLRPDDRVLEIGTGSGYQAAILAEIVKEVYTIEIIKPLADSASSRLLNMGYKNIRVKWGDGYKGWVEHALFDAIIVTAAPAQIPENLIDQLRVGGRMVIPVGTFFQELYLVTRTESGFDKKSILPVRFVPMVHLNP